MTGLHARDYPEHGEPSEVVTVHALDVDDLVATVARPVGLATSLDGVEDRPDPPITRCVRECLEPTPLELDQERLELSRLPEGVASDIRPVRVRLQHGRGVRLDHIIDVELDRGDAEPVVVVRSTSVLDRVELFRTSSSRWRRRLTRDSS
jgi:hypothetical protein